mgnify:CR=1 FL=1|tara:strand:- start:578 stop:2443 length:1866 start_codon:yes stop_codon:yes gene_type:complete
MCGISGILSNSDLRSIHFKNNFNDILSHRGPDSNGSWFSDNNKLCLFHTRLAIQDLSFNGKQPMSSKSRRFIISFNGEIYNHLKLRKILPNLKWSGTSDTETLVELIDYFGIKKTLNKIQGMFAFALYDKKEEKIFLARDRFGEKPLYYGFFENNFIFSSELKILNNLKNPENINTQSLNFYFNYLCIPSPLSIFKNFYKVFPGSYITLNLKDLKIKKITNTLFYDKKKLIFNNKKTSQFSSGVQELEDLLTSSIEDMLISDKPVGAFLSGGIDSTLICSLLAKKIKKKVKTFTIGFENKKYDESIYAKKVSELLETDHHEHIFNNDDIKSIIPEIPAVYDEPFSDSSQIPTYLVSKIAKQNVSVSLTGDGGDELFGGYNRYILTNKYWPILNLTPFYLRQIVGIILGNQVVKNYSEKFNKIGVKLRNIQSIQDLYFNYTTEMNMVNRVLKKEYHSIIPKENFDDPSLIGLNNVEKMMYFDTERYLSDDLLCKVDRASMFHSLETRAPFLNHKIYEYSLKIPFDQKISKNNSKIILKQILERYLPEKIFNRPKKGFGIPIKDFLYSELREWSKSILFDKYYRDPFLDQEKVEEFWNLTDKNKIDLTSTIWSIISFRVWYKS